MPELELQLAGASYALSGSGLLSASNEYIGEGADASFSQSGGSNLVSGLMLSGGTYLLSGSGLISAKDESVANGARFIRREVRIRCPPRSQLEGEAAERTA